MKMRQKKEMEASKKSKVYNTNVKTKAENWPKFAKLLENQFIHGGQKYSFGIEDMEATDAVCAMSPGETGFDWILQTITKYCIRYIHFQREKDLLKIATFAYIAWLKAGGHLKETHDEDIKER